MQKLILKNKWRGWEKQIDREEGEEDGLVTTMTTIKNCHTNVNALRILTLKMWRMQRLTSFLS